MRRSLLLAAFATSVATSSVSNQAWSQYPQVPGDIQRAADEAKSAADQRSDHDQEAGEGRHQKGGAEGGGEV